MNLTKKDIGSNVEILAADEFTAIPVKCAGTAVLKAGTPLTAAGAAALNGSSAVGILLYDVDPTVNPNGAMVVAGVVDYAKAKANAGITATAATLQSAIPTIRFRTDIGVNDAFTSSDYALTVVASSTATATLSNASGAITVTTSDAGVATGAESSGTLTVTGVAAGTCLITATDAAGNYVTIAVTCVAAS